ncbi:MAG: anhydro-N-acetylmuramic acid kinase [Lapillicoccus sp.]
MKVLGLISGTSHDGIDAAVVDFTLDGDVLSGSITHSGSTPYAAGLRRRLVAALPPADTTLAEVCELDTLIGQAFADVAVAVTADVGALDLVVSHGQTVFHWVQGDHALGTLQLGQPAWIAEATGLPVLADVRIRDITAGGHGAPLVSYLDVLLLKGMDGTAAALNLGGIANMTVVRPDGAVLAYDIGPANALVDAVVVGEGLSDLGYDEGGQLAATGTVHAGLLAHLLSDPYFALPAPKSTGKEHFHGDYVADAVSHAGVDVGTADLVATLTAFTAESVARDVRARGVETLVVSGGGWRNATLMAGLREALPGVRVTSTDELGAPSDTKEAVAFALIGWCTMHGLPGANPMGTGAREPRILGALTPGSGPLALPTPLERAPARLVLRTVDTVDTA